MSLDVNELGPFIVTLMFNFKPTLTNGGGVWQRVSYNS